LKTPGSFARVHHDCRVEPGSKAGLRKRSTDDTFGNDRKDAEAEHAERVEQLALLHNRLWAERKRSVLLVLQGLDASGKDGTIKRVFSGVNPQGCRVHSFKAPAGAELEHDYLWRIHAALPARGELGIFNRSHYEDIVTCKVLGIIDEAERKRRIAQVNDFERMLTEEGTRVLKVFLHLGKDEQRERLQARLDDPEKNWKFRKEDLDTRKQWDTYRDEYDDTISATSTDWAPWYVVPADRKWLSGFLVAGMLCDTLEAMDPKPPPPEADLDGLVVE
jgi:PPK2 family polyphosphate:nucleotide phosphotransferase